MGGVYQERNYYEVGFWLKKIRKHIRWYGNFPHCWKTHLTLIMYIGANNTPDNTINAMFFNEFHSIISCCNWIWPYFHISWLDCWEETKIMFCLQLLDNNIFFPVSVHSDLSYPPPTVAHTSTQSSRSDSHFRKRSTLLSYRVDKKLWAVKADASQTFYYHLVEAYMENWFCQLNMAEVTGTLRHISRTSLATRVAIDSPLSWIHEATQLWSTAFHRFRIFYASLCRNRHLFL